jgi:DNA modification methylase
MILEDITLGPVRLIRGDCTLIAPTLEGVDAVITDPPYGMNWDTDNSRFSGGNVASVARRGNGPGTNDGKPIINDDTPFDPVLWITYPKCVLFGSNHYAQRLPVGTTLVYIKRYDEAFQSFLSDAEVAWMKGGHGVYCRRDLSMARGANDRKHPSQKPVGIMVWCMDMAKVQPGSLILDPFMGSGTTLIAAMRTGRRAIGIEIDPKHYQTAVDRVRRELSQLTLPMQDACEKFTNASLALPS